MALDLSKFIGRFVDEAREHLGALEQGLAQLEANPDNKELINGLFRSAHTIKGTSRMLKLASITDTAHQLEDVLGALRDASLRMDSPLARLLEQGIDQIAKLVDKVAAKEPLPDADEALLTRLARAATPKTGATDHEQVQGQASPPAAEPATQTGAEAPRTPAPSPAAKASTTATTSTAKIQLQAAESVRVRLDRLDALIKLMGELNASHSHLEPGLKLLEQLALQLGKLRPDQATSSDLTGLVHEFKQGINLCKEVFINQKLLMQELSAQALGLRMLPLSTILEDSARQVRELGRFLGKEVRCLVSGAEIELDRQLISLLPDPIVHILRNAVDHGIEDPELRTAAGKPAQARIEIRASQEGASVLLEIRDDGAGLPTDKIRSKALARELITAEQAKTLTEEQVLDLIFMPGFSTSSIITDVSGRGVGLDVVRQTVINKLQGSVSVQSQPGQGTSFLIRLPTTLAMMQILLCETDGLLLGFAAQHVYEIRRVLPSSRIDIGGRIAFVHHNEFVPLVRFSRLLGLDQTGPAKAPPNGDLVILLRGRNSKLGLVVDRVMDERDLVVNPMPEHLRNLPLVSGMVLYDNRLVSLLQPQGLVDLARAQRNEGLIRQTTDSLGTAAPKAWQVLVVDDSFNTREIEKEVLEAHGFIVGLAKDGADGLRKAQQQHYDAVLTDVEMPIMDGFTLTERLRELPAYAGTPIIIVTSREKDEDKRRGIRAGADAYIVKGDFDQTNLVDTLRNLLT